MLWCDKLGFTNKLTLFDSVTFTQVLIEVTLEKGYPDKFHPYINSSTACKGNQIKDMGQILKILCNFWILKSFWHFDLHFFFLIYQTASQYLLPPAVWMWAKLLQSFWLFVTLWTVAHQPGSLCPWGFLRQEYLDCHVLLQENLPDPGIELTSLVFCTGTCSLPIVPSGNPTSSFTIVK